MKEQPRKKSLKLLVSIFIVVLIVGTLLAASCGKAAETTKPAATTAPVTTAVQPVKLVFTTHEASGGYYQKGFFDPWIAELEKRTNGKVKIEAHWGGELVGISDAYDAAVNGTVDVAWFLQMMVTDKFPMDDVVAFTSYDKINYQHSLALWQLYKEFPEFQNEYKDVHPLFIAATYFTSLTTTKKCGPINTFDQFKGKKMIGVGKWPSNRLAALGVTVASMPPQDVYPAYEKGIVDGGPMGTMMILKDQGWGDIMPYITRYRTNSSSIAMVMNKNVWNKLPKDVQDAIDGMAEWAINLHDTFNVAVDKEIYDLLPSQYGTQFFTLAPGEAAKMMAADQAVKDAYVKELNDKGYPGTKLMEEYLKLENQYSTPPAK